MRPRKADVPLLCSYGTYDMNIALMSKGDRKLVREMARKKTGSVRVLKPDPE